MNSRMTILSIIFIGVLLISACAPPVLDSSTRGGDADLTGTNWMLTTLNDSQPVPTTTITINFDDEGRVNGSDGCNNYSGSYEVDGNNIKFGQMASTMMACPDPIMKQANAYQSVMAETTTFEISGDELNFNDADGNPVATFSVVSNDLSGTSWQVISYNNGKQAVVSVIIGTELTAEFGDDGELKGNAGCNDYFGPYETDDKAISMGPFGTTRKACQEPEGVMEQETLYLQALESAAVYKIDGNKMEMRTSEGSMAANFQRTQ